MITPESRPHRAPSRHGRGHSRRPRAARAPKVGTAPAPRDARAPDQSGGPARRFRAGSSPVTFVRPVQLGERLVAEAREIASAERNGTYQVTVRGEDGGAVASFHGHCRTLGGAVVAT